MALKIADRLRETTRVSGTATILLLGAQPGYQAFGSVMADLDTCYYAVIDPVNGAWEIGLGTYHLAANSISRTTVISSSNANALVVFAGGVACDVFCTIPASVLQTRLGL